MGIEVYLGKPPTSIEQWIRDHHVPVVKPETHIKFVDGTEGDYLIEGAMDCPALVAAGLMPPGSGTEEEPSWIKQPLKANVGSAVTSIGNFAFFICSSLTSVMIPDGVMSIGRWAFSNCYELTNMTIPDSVTIIYSEAFYYCKGLTNVTFLSKDTATVQGMENYGQWGFPSGCILHCTDGDITI